MQNVPRHEPRRGAIMVLLDNKPELEDGDIVAWQWISSRPDSRIILAIWEGRKGRDGRGRFVPSGHPEELIGCLDGIQYTAKDLVRPGAPLF